MKKNANSYELSEFIVKKFKARVVHDTLYVFRKNDGYFYRADEDTIAELICSELNIGISNKKSKSIYKQLLTNPYIVMDDNTIPNGIVLFENGIFDINTGKQVTDSDNVFFNYKVHANYNETLTETPVFDNFIDSITGGDVEAKKIITAFIGYCLIPDIDAKKFFVIGTATNTGKSVLANFLTELLGDDSVNCGIYTPSMIDGMHLNIGHGICCSGKLSNRNVDYIKSIAENNKNISRNITTKLIFITDEPVILKEDDHDFWDDMIVLPFIKKTPREKRNIHLLEDLLNEKEGIITKCIHEVRNVIKNDYEFPNCKISNDMKHEWRFYNIKDIIEFVEYCCDLSDSESTESIEDLYNEYLEYSCILDHRHKNIARFRNALSDYFNLQLIRKFDGEHCNIGFKGIKILDEWG